MSIKRGVLMVFAPIFSFLHTETDGQLMADVVYLKCMFVVLRKL